MNLDRHNPSGPGLRLALYLRNSGKEQELSIAQQRGECQRYALSRGWELVVEYLDEGKSGSKDIDKRQHWHRMIADAANTDRGWDAILCWDSSRFGRLDSLDGAPYKNKLRKAGVWLETTKGEHIDWNTSMGRVMDALQSENNNEYSLNISRNVIRGRRDIIKKGYWATKLPFGFDRKYVEASDTGTIDRMIIPRGQVFSKPRNWRLVPIINEAEAKMIRWLFAEWRDKDLSITGTVKMLCDKKILSPSGQESWTFQQVKRLLTERAYVGDAVIGSGERSREVHGRIGEQVKENAFEGIVDRKTFEIVVAKVREREGAEWRPRTAAGPLSGVLKCGHCGHTLARRTYAGRTKYVCESQMRRPHLGCRQWRVDEAEVLPAICKEITASIDFELLAALGRKHDEKEVDAEITRHKEAEAKAKRNVERAGKNILLVDPENFQTAQDALSTLRKEHERIANALRLAESEKTGGEHKGVNKWWENGRKVIELTGRKYCMKYIEPHFASPYSNARLTSEHAEKALDVTAFRDLLRRLGVEVSFFWTRKHRRNWALTTGTLRAQFNPGVASEREVFAANKECRLSHTW